MDQKELDARLRDAFRESAPRTDDARFCEEVGAKLYPGPGKRRSRRGLRLLAIACASLLVLGGLAVGNGEMVDHFGRGSAIIVITDTPTSSTPIPSSSTTTTTVPAAPTLDFQGLWAGNIETVPAHPASLPAQFYAEPKHPANLVMGKPLWIFASELTPEEAAAALKSVPEEQTVLVFDPSEKLCALLDIPVNQRPSSMGELSPLFSERPLLIRDKVFAEVGPYWSLQWVDMGRPAASGFTYDPATVYASGAAVTMHYEEVHEVTEKNKADATTSTSEGGSSTTSTGDPYPIQKNVRSAQAEELAKRAGQELQALTGQKFQIGDALEIQMIGPEQKLEMREHTGYFTLPGATEKGRGLTYSVFWSAQDQLAYISSNTNGQPATPFDLGPGSKGIIISRVEGTGYQAILQLADGMTANVNTWGPPAWKLNPPAVSAPLTPERLIAFAKWLVVQAEYLHP